MELTASTWMTLLRAPPAGGSHHGLGMTAEIHDDRFIDLYKDQFLGIKNYCRRRLDPTDVDDAVSEIFTVAWRRRENMPDGNEARLWLYGVARNVVSNIRRGNTRRIRLASKMNSQRHSTTESPENRVVARSTNDIMLEALNSLSVRDQEVLRLRAWEDLDRHEIAKIVGIKPTAVDMRLRRALARLAKSRASHRRPGRSGRPSMREQELLLEALRQADPANDPHADAESIPDFADVVGDETITLRSPQPHRRRPGPLALVAVFVAVLSIGLASTRLFVDQDRSDVIGPPVAPAAEPLDRDLTWCNAGILEYEIDPSDEASVRTGYSGLLAADRIRAVLAPDTIAEEADLLAEDTERIVAELEAAGWDLSAVDVTRSQEAMAAQDVLDAFASENCAPSDSGSAGTRDES